MSRSVFTITEADLYDALIDTRYDLRVIDITDPERAEAYLEKLDCVSLIQILYF